MCLWSSEDVAAGHFRRYTLKQLSSLLEQNDFSICYRSYFMSFLFLPILFIRVLGEKISFSKREKTKTEQNKVAQQRLVIKKGIVSGILSFFEKCERFLIKKTKVPIGSSIIIVARKK